MLPDLAPHPAGVWKKKSTEWTPTQALCKTLSEVCDGWLMEQQKSYCSNGETGQSQHTEDDATEDGKTLGPWGRCWAAQDHRVKWLPSTLLSSNNTSCFEGRKEGGEGGRQKGGRRERRWKEGRKEREGRGGREGRFLFPTCPGSRRHDGRRAWRQAAPSWWHLPRLQHSGRAVHFYTL